LQRTLAILSKIGKLGCSFLKITNAEELCKQCAVYDAKDTIQNRCFDKEILASQSRKSLFFRKIASQNIFPSSLAKSGTPILI
jgi:hypothetical protein